MRAEVSSSSTTTPWLVKRRRLVCSDPMESQIAKAKLSEMAEKLGREIHVFMTSTDSSAPEKAPDIASEKAPMEEESDDFYEFTAEDYFRVLSTKKEDKRLKTRKLREAEEAARKSRMTKAVIRVRFPDNYTLEAKFHSSEMVQSLIDLLMKVVAQPDIPFYVYTTPPKKQIKDMSQDFYSAGFVPGAIVYFSYELPKGDETTDLNSIPFLQDEIKSLNGLHLISEPIKFEESAPEPAVPVAAPSPVVQEAKPAEKKAMPKWFKR